MKRSKTQCELTTDPRTRAAADELAASIAEGMPAGLSQPVLPARAGVGAAAGLLCAASSGG